MRDPQGRLVKYSSTRSRSSSSARPRKRIARNIAGQVIVAAYDETGQVVLAAGTQLPGVLDDLFDATGRELGVGWDWGIPTVAVWAPTAQQVNLLTWPAGSPDQECRLALPANFLPDLHNCDLLVLDDLRPPRWLHCRRSSCSTPLLPEEGGARLC